MSEKIISQEELKRILHYCPETGLFTNLFTRRGGARKDTMAGYIEKTGYVAIKLNYVTYRAHTLAVIYMTGKYPESEVDHIDHDRSNNSWGNLRLATRGENARNKAMNKNNTSGITGVTWDSGRNKWKASIHTGGKRKHIGMFNCVTAAAIARKAAEIKLGYHVNHGV